MRVVSGVLLQESWSLVNYHVINSTLHRAKEMVVKVRDVYRLVDNQVVLRGGLWVDVGDYSRDRLVRFTAKGFVIPLDRDWSLKI